MQASLGPPLITPPQDQPEAAATPFLDGASLLHTPSPLRNRPRLPLRRPASTWREREGTVLGQD